MTWKASAVRKSRKLLKTIYSPRVKYVAEELGTDVVLRNIYSRIDIPHESMQRYTVNDTEIKIKTYTAYQSEALPRYLDEERFLISKLLEEIKPNDVFYDIGAFYGAYSCLVKECEPAATAHAFEPGSKRQSWFQETTDINDVNVTLHPVALGHKEAKMELSSNGVITLSNGQETIQVVNGDRYIKRSGLNPPSVVKIDVEGEECNVIKGMENTLAKYCRLIYCEIHQDVNSKKVISKLENMGFEVDYIKSDRDSTKYISARS